jgi:hypothetical protein
MLRRDRPDPAARRHDAPRSRVVAACEQAAAVDAVAVVAIEGGDTVTPSIAFRVSSPSLETSRAVADAVWPRDSARPGGDLPEGGEPGIAVIVDPIDALVGSWSEVAWLDSHRRRPLPA